MQEQVSVIIPVYNVEKYIGRCLDSIVKQTYENLQIIVVNDGSRDNAVEIIHKYIQKDNRIELFNKENGGLSDARNYGLKYARGEYVCFIDSDDWVTYDYIETLIKQFSTEIDITCAGFDLAFENNVFNSFKYRMKNKILSSDSALVELCIGKWMTNHVFNKMFRLSLFKNIEFDVGRTFEDIYIMHKLFAKARKISCSSQIIYHYFMRNDSIVHQDNPQHSMDIFIGYFQRYQFVENKIMKIIVLKYCACASYRVLFIENNKLINKEDLEATKDFWKMHDEIKWLGIKYYIMYRFPILYLRIIRRK